MKNRFWEIDCLRGIAIIMMIFFHFLFDLFYFASYSFNVYSGFWGAFGRATAAIFIMLVGVSLSISYSRVKDRPDREIWIKYFRRGSKIFCYGLLISGFTLIVFPNYFIIMGVLHFIGISIMISRPFQNLGRWNLLLGVSAILSGIYLLTLRIDYPWLLWTGLMPQGFYTFDYFPLLPWFGFVLLGIFFGNILYPQGKRRFSVPEVSNPLIRFLNYLGRKSLLIYFIHQPLLVGILYLFIPDLVLFGSLV